MSVIGLLQKGGIEQNTIVQTKRVRITNAELKALRATPKVLVSAQGTYTFLELVGALIRLNAGTNVLTESADNLVVRYGSASGATASETIEMTGFITQSVDTITNVVPKIDTIVTESAGRNAALVLHNTGDGEFGGNAAGDATLEVHVLYRVHKLPNV